MVGLPRSSNKPKPHKKRINDFLIEQPEIVDGPGVLQKVEGNLSFKNVSLCYPETEIQALNNINLEISKGTTIGVIGNIGSGKSTFLDLISRLYDPSEGKIELDGKDLKEYRLEELRSFIGYVPQNAFLYFGKHRR